MLEKIKGYFTYVLGGLVACLSIALAIVLGLKRKDEAKISELEGKSALKDALEKQAQAKEEAQNAEDDYKRARDQFLASEHGAGGDTDLH